jgi:hypothetical protein
MSMPGSLSTRAFWLPVLLLLAAMAAFYIGLPYAFLDSDVTTFGLMGEDIFRFHYLPTLAYGQTYLLSLTPYLYAFWKLILPAGTAPALLLALGGSMLSLGGLAMVFESLRVTQARRTGGAFWPAVLLAGLIAGNTTYITDLAENSGVELALFVMGAMMWAGARLENAPAAGSAPRRSLAGWWCLLGAAMGYGSIARPLMVVYGLILAGVLLTRTARREGLRAAVLAIAALASGLLLGYFPMLLHKLFRAADWPSQFHTPVYLGTGKQIAHSARVSFGDILPIVFGVRSDMHVKPLRLMAWATVALGGYGWAVIRRSERLSVLDHALLLGSLASLVFISLVPTLSVNAEQRRYCLPAFLSGAWLCARLAPAPGWRNAATGAFCLILLAVSVPRWSGRIEKSSLRDRQMRETRNLLVPELVARNAVILTPYFDAYVLAFLAEGRLRVEAYPWEHVRNYGLIPKADYDRRTLWLIPRGHGRRTMADLKRLLGTDGVPHPVDVGVKAAFVGRRCELWEFPDPRMASRLMLNLQPLYFDAPYPPGTGPVRRQGQDADTERQP